MALASSGFPRLALDVHIRQAQGLKHTGKHRVELLLDGHNPVSTDWVEDVYNEEGIHVQPKVREQSSVASWHNQAPQSLGLTREAAMPRDAHPVARREGGCGGGSGERPPAEAAAWQPHVSDLEIQAPPPPPDMATIETPSVPPWIGWQSFLTDYGDIAPPPSGSSQVRFGSSPDISSTGLTRRAAEIHSTGRQRALLVGVNYGDTLAELKSSWLV